MFTYFLTYFWLVNHVLYFPLHSINTKTAPSFIMDKCANEQNAARHLTLVFVQSSQQMSTFTNRYLYVHFTDRKLASSREHTKSTPKALEFMILNFPKYNRNSYQYRVVIQDQLVWRNDLETRHFKSFCRVP